MTEHVNEYAAGQKDARPWGDWEVLDSGHGYCVKRIRVIPGGRLSLQKHEHRAEHWVCVAGRPRVTVGSAVRDLVPGEAIDIDIGDVHRMENPGGEDFVIIEIQRGKVLRETDIERLEDAYGRT